MLRYMLKSKIHRAVVTEADLNYVGSITIDKDIMDAADIIENEKVTIVNNNNVSPSPPYLLPGIPNRKLDPSLTLRMTKLVFTPARPLFS